METISIRKLLIMCQFYNIWSLVIKECAFTKKGTTSKLRVARELCRKSCSPLLLLLNGQSDTSWFHSFT